MSEIKKMGIECDLSLPADELVSDWERQQRELSIRRRLKASLPEGCENKRFENFICESEKQINILNLCKKASEKIRNGGFITICFLGTYGIGKTHLAISMMADVIENGRKDYVHTYEQDGQKKNEVFRLGMKAKYILIPEFIERYFAAKSFSSKETQAGVIKDATDADLIVLDEIGRGQNPKEESEILYRIFNQCWLEKKSIVAISNMKFQEFAQHLGGATMDRLKDSAVFPNLEAMESFRGRK